MGEVKGDQNQKHNINQALLARNFLAFRPDLGVMDNLMHWILQNRWRGRSLMAMGGGAADHSGPALTQNRTGDFELLMVPGLRVKELSGSAEMP